MIEAAIVIALMAQVNAVPAKVSKAESLMQRADACYSKNDYSGALASYAAAAHAEPNLYQAPLFAGVASFRMNDFAGADVWFAKAVAIGPDIETAYRYWGDSFLAANKPVEAREKFIDAIIAQPYTQASWGGLQQWGQRTQTPVESPRINRPKIASDVKTMTVDPAIATEDGSGRSAWITYSLARAVYRSTAFPQKFPNEPVYRHTLAEEVDCLERVAAAVKEKNIPLDKLDPGLRVLLSLTADHMLEAWILLHGADEGIVKDYPAFRTAHQDLLRAYIERYDIGITAPAK